MTLLAGVNGSLGEIYAVTLNFTVASSGTVLVVVWSIGGTSAAELPPGVVVVAEYSTAVCCGSAGIAAGVVAAGNYSVSVQDTFEATTAFSVAVYGIQSGESYGYFAGVANESTSLAMPSGAALFLAAEGTGGYYGANNSSLTTIDEQSPGLISGSTEKIGRQTSNLFNFTTLGASYGIVALGIYTQVYSVTFTATGLPPATAWTLNLTPGISYQSTGTSILVNLINGSYSYSLGTAYSHSRAYLAASGALTVAGAASAVAISFARAYPVTVHAVGLPAGDPWFVNVSGQPGRPSFVPTLRFLETPGGYTFTIASGDHRYRPIVPGGTFNVHAAGVSKRVKFLEVLYPVTFSESGLPTGARWCVAIDGAHPHCTTRSTFVAAEPNGSFSYVLSTPRPGYSATGGVGEVNGSAVALAVTFTQATYTVAFDFPSFNGSQSLGSNWWSVEIGSQAAGTYSALELVLDEPNGTYTYSLVLSEHGTLVLTGQGIVTVDGGDVVVELTLASFV